MYVIQYNDVYVDSVGIGNVGTKLTESEYNSIIQKIQNKPTAPSGYTYKLRADPLEWELAELPPAPEPSEDQAEIEDYENALVEMGVDLNGD